MREFAPSSRIVFAVVLAAAMAWVGMDVAGAEDAIVGRDAVGYAISVKDVIGQQVGVEARFPVAEARTVLYMPVWTPGYYVRESYKANVTGIRAYDAAGRELAIEDSGGSRWMVDTAGVSELVVRYVLSAKGRSVSQNEVAGDYAVLNGSATYIAAKGHEKLPQEVELSLPVGWNSATGLRQVGQDRFVADDYEELVDSPIMAGNLGILEFESAGTPHSIVYNRGVVEVDAARVVADLKAMTDETRRFWKERPWRKYVFLIAFRDAGGGLEHAYSTFVNVNPERFGTPVGYNAFVSLLAHEYQHAFNVKRLRPLELGPFDYESVPALTTLWISEGLTSYYSNLMLRRSGLIDIETYLGVLSKQITGLQNSPGRLKQSLEQSSMEVWSNSLSGIGASSETVSYYVKGEVAGFLLDAHLRRITLGRKSLDDVIKRAYAEYSGETGFRPEDFSRVAEEVAGQPLADWFSAVIGSASEVDYSGALDWYGLELTSVRNGDRNEWALSVSDRADDVSKERLREWLSSGQD